MEKLELLKISSFSYSLHCEYLKLQDILDPIAWRDGPLNLTEAEMENA